MNVLLARLVLIAVLAAASSAALAQSKDESQQTGAADPIATTGDAPSRAVGATHNCTGFYPDRERRTGEAGDVLVGYDVGADGAISNVAVIKSSGDPDLDSAAIACVSTHWRNTPALRGGVPVATQGHRAIIRFTLRQPFNFNPIMLLTGIPSLTVIAIGLGILAFGGLLAFLLERGQRRR